MNHNDILDEPDNPQPKRPFVKFEIIFGCAAFIGLLFKIQHWPGTGIILDLSISALAVLYFSLGVYMLKNRYAKEQNTLLLGVSSIVHAIILMGFLFKLQRWPGGHLYVTIAAIASIILLFALLYVQTNVQPSTPHHLRIVVTRTIILTVVAIFSYMS